MKRGGFGSSGIEAIDPEAIFQKMQFDVRYKEVTFETLNRKNLLDAVKKVYPKIDWDKAHNEFRAAGEKEKQDP